MATEDVERTERPRPLTVGLRIYQQIAAVMAAIAIAAMLSQIADLEWRGFIANLVGYWDEYARPAVKWLFDLLITTPLRWAFGWQFEVPLAVRDYVAVGMITVLSMFRALELKIKSPSRLETMRYVVVGLPLSVVLWPVFFGGFLTSALFVAEDRLKYVLAIAPVLYLGLLFAVNYLVL